MDVSSHHPRRGKPGRCENPARKGFGRTGGLRYAAGKAGKEAASRTGLAKRIACRAFRHFIATHSLEEGDDIRTIQELSGRRDVTTTMIYTHVPNRGGKRVRSPLDLPKKTRVKISQIRTLAVERIGKRSGRAAPEELSRVLEGLMKIVGT